MITVVLKALARGKLTALAVVATLIVVTASAAVATNPPMSVDSSTTNVDEFNTEQDLDDAANSSESLSQAIYSKQLTSTGRNLKGDDREDDGRQVAAVACDEGDFVLSGGHFKVDKGTTLVASGPNPRHNSWKLVWINDQTEDSTGVKVLCADMGTPDTVPAPEATTPEATSPESASPEVSASATASPEATSDPAATSPEAAAPEGTTLEASASATATSEASASPEASVPEVSVPKVTPPEGVPE